MMITVEGKQVPLSVFVLAIIFTLILIPVILFAILFWIPMWITILLICIVVFAKRKNKKGGKMRK